MDGQYAGRSAGQAVVLLAEARAKADQQELILALAATVREQFTRYVAFHSDVCDEEADTLTLWVMHTHAFDACETTPYMAIMAPTEEAGKSKIIDVAQHLVRHSEVVNDPSPASLYRMIDAKHPTLFIDEVDIGLRLILR